MSTASRAPSRCSSSESGNWSKPDCGHRRRCGSRCRRAQKRCSAWPTAVCSARSCWSRDERSREEHRTMMTPTALAFDVFGTVVDWRSSIIRELEEFGRHHGLQQDWPSFADNWRAGYGPAMDRVRRGDLPWTRIDDLHRMILEELLGAAGM